MTLIVCNNCKKETTDVLLVCAYCDSPLMGQEKEAGSFRFSRPKALKVAVEKRSVSACLVLCIVVLPFIFVWMLLRQGHSVLARMLGFAWLVIFFNLSSQNHADRVANPVVTSPVTASNTQHRESSMLYKLASPSEWDKADANTAQEDAANKIKSLEVSAAILCKEAITERLISPATADFPWTLRANNTSEDTYFVESYVDSQNAFGAALRINFSCMAVYKGGETFRKSSWDITPMLYR